MERVRTGVPNLDALVGGGFTKGDAILVKGKPGAGKTVLGMQWLCGGAAELDEPGAIVVLEETPQQFYQRAHAFGWDLRKLEEQNKVRTIFTSAETLSHDIMSGSLLVGILAEIGARRVVIDPITHYRLVYKDLRQLRQQVYGTINALKRLGQTSILTAEVGSDGWSEPAPEEYLADVVISLGYGPANGHCFRQLQVSKASAHHHHAATAPYRIAPEGIRLITPQPFDSSRFSEGIAAGLSGLYEALGGSLHGGSFYVMEVETNIRRVMLDLGLVTMAKTQADNTIYLANSFVSPAEFWELAAAGDGGQADGLSMIEPHGRRRPSTCSAHRFRTVSGYHDDRVLPVLATAQPQAEPGPAPGSRLMVLCDLSDILYHAGLARFQALLPRIIDDTKAHKASLIGVLDSRLMTPQSHAWVRGMADGVARISEENGVRFVEVVKSASGRLPTPRLFVETGEPPFLEAID